MTSSGDETGKKERMARNSTKDSEVTCTAELLQIDSHPKISQRVPLYERRYTETAD
jgi:hypothetical protein